MHLDFCTEKTMLNQHLATLIVAILKWMVWIGICAVIDITCCAMMHMYSSHSHYQAD